MLTRFPPVNSSKMIFRLAALPLDWTEMTSAVTILGKTNFSDASWGVADNKSEDVGTETSSAGPSEEMILRRPNVLVKTNGLNPLLVQCFRCFWRRFLNDENNFDLVPRRFAAIVAGGGRMRMRLTASLVDAIGSSL